MIPSVSEFNFCTLENAFFGRIVLYENAIFLFRKRRMDLSSLIGHDSHRLEY